MLRPKLSVGAPFAAAEAVDGLAEVREAPEEMVEARAVRPVRPDLELREVAAPVAQPELARAWRGFHGSRPRFGSPRCQAWSAQWLPSGMVQPVTNHGELRPRVPAGTRSANPRTSVLRYVPQPPE